jgi:hypothetical protein
MFRMPGEQSAASLEVTSQILLINAFDWWPSAHVIVHSQIQKELNFSKLFCPKATWFLFLNYTDTEVHLAFLKK